MFGGFADLGTTLVVILTISVIGADVGSDFGEFCDFGTILVLTFNDLYELGLGFGSDFGDLDLSLMVPLMLA